jgi:hypothetical protein
MRCLAVVLFVLPLCAQQATEAPPQRRAPEPPKNLKVLKPEELMPTMRSFTGALGVRCDYCHIRGDFASDENHKKLTARRMIAMVQQINGSFFEGKMEVACYTCHRGATEPEKTPVASLPREQ